MGYVMVMGPCIGCGKTFSFNPTWVPSCSAVTGKREPICEGCVIHVNPMRIKNGLEPIVPSTAELKKDQKPVVAS